jgi:hypothetical protein
MIAELNSTNNDYNLTTQQTVLTDTPDASNAMLCQAFISIGDGSKDLHTNAVNLEIEISVGGQTLLPQTQQVYKAAAVLRAGIWSSIFPVPANNQVLVKLKSLNSSDADVDVTAYLYDVFPINVASGIAESNLKKIDDDSVTGNAATLTLKQLDVQNIEGNAIIAKSIGGNGYGLEVGGNGSGVGALIVGGATNANGLQVTGQGTGNGIVANGGTSAGIGLQLNKGVGGKDIDAGEIDDILEDTNATIPGLIEAAAPMAHAATGENETTLTSSVNDGDATATNNGTTYQIVPAGSADGNGNGLDIDLVFTVGTGLSRTPVSVNIAGFFDNTAPKNRVVHIWAMDYVAGVFVKLSDSGSAMADATTNQNYQQTLNPNYINTANGEVRIGFRSTSINTGDVLEIDYASIGSVAVAAAGLTADSIAEAVASHDVSQHTSHDSFGFRAGLSLIDEYAVTTADTAISFTCSGLPATANYYQGQAVRIHDVTNERYAGSWIKSMTNAGVVTLGRTLPFTPDTSAELYILPGLITPAENVAGLLAATGITVGDSWTFAELFKVMAAMIAGKWQDKAGESGTYEVLDPDDGDTVVLEITPSAATPQKTVSVEI